MSDLYRLCPDQWHHLLPKDRDEPCPTCDSTGPFVTYIKVDGPVYREATIAEFTDRQNGLDSAIEWRAVVEIGDTR